MHITLISPRLAIQKNDFLGSGVPYWPVDLAYLAAFLKNQNHSLSVFDLFGSNPFHFEEKADHYLQGAPLPTLPETDWVIVYAISAMSHAEILNLVQSIKHQKPQTPVAVWENSQAVTAYALDHLSVDFWKAGADFLICGEPYWNWNEIQNFAIKQDSAPSNVVTPDSAAKPQRLYQAQPSYLQPAWELFPIQNYWKLPYAHGPKTKRYLPMLTSKGCPYPCDFCVVPETNSKNWRARSASEVVAEMLSLKEKFGVDCFQIEDLNPTVNTKRWREVCELLIKARANIRYFFVSGTKAETVKLEDIPFYAESGCAYLSISPESGSPDILKKIGKPFPHDYATDLIKQAHAHGIRTQACFIVGHPGETPADQALSQKYVKTLVKAGLDEIAVFVIAPLAGSQLFKTQQVSMQDSQKLVSFSPKGRENYATLARYRRELIGTFFIEKLKRGAALWLQGLRAMFGTPQTKMENLPKRMLWIYWRLFKIKPWAKHF